MKNDGIIGIMPIFAFSLFEPEYACQNPFPISLCDSVEVESAFTHNLEFIGPFCRFITAARFNLGSIVK
ncbi:hypothetical protein ACFOLF_17880 [Paenibacillus sepulcri]|uniref:Uncharacterized protein n=1 Tax=Paenibacillus sepulcri TaxID=359917 RepID=A0ABS7BVD3_9BACL|nr:hypothetical protein [Paenibacillus sepulcri]